MGPPPEGGAVAYRVVIYCPDRHIVYDGRTPYQVGVGGGISTRVRMARALSRRGHQVTQIVNCPRHEIIDGVEYVPLGEVSRIQTDVLIGTTSGGELDLGPLLKLQSDCRLFLVWVHGISKPGSVDELRYHSLYAVSNFIADFVADEWGVDRHRVFVSYNGFEEDIFSLAEESRPPRDPYRLVYFSHPSKGLDAAAGVVRRLRQADSRYHLVVLGGPRLWGQPEGESRHDEGVEYRGLVGQPALAQELLQCQFSLNLQTRQEPGALAIVDALRAGCILIGSPVGCYSEMVIDGRDGFLIPGDSDDEETQQRAAATILVVSESRGLVQRIRQRAQSLPWNTDTLAQAWTEHWEWALRDHERNERRGEAERVPACPWCGSSRLGLADGYHCLGCGRYQRVVE